MANHSRNLTHAPSLILQTASEGPQRYTDHQAREHVAALARLGFLRVAPSLVARPLDRSERNVYGWREPGMVGGLRAHDLLVCPRPFARTVVRGLVVAIDGAPPPDGPSRSSLAALLARIGGLLLVVAHEDPAALPDEVLRERIRSLDEAEGQLRRERQRYDLEALRRARQARQGEG
jgi:hypothetical protein